MRKFRAQRHERMRETLILGVRLQHHHLQLVVGLVVELTYDSRTYACTHRSLRTYISHKTTTFFISTSRIP